jgi:hypothetical protein
MASKHLAVLLLSHTDLHPYYSLEEKESEGGLKIWGVGQTLKISSAKFQGSWTL